MIEWIAIGGAVVRRIDSHGVPTQVYRRTLLARVVAGDINLAKLVAPAGTRNLYSVASLRVKDPDGWLLRDAGSYLDTSLEGK